MVTTSHDPQYPNPYPRFSFLLGSTGELKIPTGKSRASRTWTYKLEAAPDAGLDVAAPEGGHLPQLPGDLDGVVQQQPQPALVTEASGTCHLFEQVWRKEKDTRGQALLPGCGKQPRSASFPKLAGAVNSLGGHEHKHDSNLAASFPINTVAFPVKCESSLILNSVNGLYLGRKAPLTQHLCHYW